MPTLLSAEEYRRTKVALADRAVALANRGEDVGLVVVRHQAAGALVAGTAVGSMLAEQGTPIVPDADLNPLAFTADPDAVRDLVANVDEKWRFDRLVSGLVVDSMLAAESVSVVTRPRTGYIRYVGPSCCSRCAILAGKFYRWNSGFLRHTRCRCVHVPTTDPRSEYLQDPMQLVREGRVTGLSKADMRALADGADLNQLVNFRRGGLELASFGPGRTMTVSREGITKRGLAYRGRTGRNMTARLTPDSIYRVAGSREQAIEMLRLHGYVTAGAKRAAASRVASGKPAAATGKPPVAASGGRGGGAGIPPKATLGAFGEPPDPSDKPATRAYWQARQDALERTGRFTSSGERLEADEVLFVERMLAADPAHRLSWISTGANGADRYGTLPTNDALAIGLDPGSPLQIEHKGLEATTPVDFKHIARQVKKALAKNRRTRIVHNVIVDVGNRDVSRDLVRELADFYDITPPPLDRLWLMSHGRLVRVLPK